MAKTEQNKKTNQTKMKSEASWENIVWSKIPVSRRQFLQGMGAGAVALAGAGLPRTSWSTNAKVLKVRDYVDLQTFDPAFATSLPEDTVMGCVFSKLTNYVPGKKWNWKLEAADSIEQVDPTHIKFMLKPGIMFTNGFGELTAEDVKFSFERIIDPKLNSAQKNDWGSLNQVEVTGKYSGTIVLSKPFQPLWMTTLPYMAGNILSKKGLESVNNDYGTSPPCFSGPYILKEWKPKQYTILGRNPLWKGPQPVFDEIHIFPIEDEKTAEMAYEAGDIDFTRISISSYILYKDKPPKNTTVAQFPSLYNHWLGMNVDNPKLKDIRVRKAIQMAVNVPDILEAAYSGAADPATGFVSPGFPGHREMTLTPLKGNIALAKKMLAEAGFPNGIDVTLDVQNKTIFNTAAQVIQSTLAQAGIRVQINMHEGGAFWTLGSEAAGDRWKNIELILTRFSTGPDPYYQITWWTCDQVGKWNWMRFCNKRFDDLNDIAMSSSDPVKRAECYVEMQDILEDSGAFKFITHESTCLMWRNTITPAMRPDGIPLLRYFKLNKG